MLKSLCNQPTTIRLGYVTSRSIMLALQWFKLSSLLQCVFLSSKNVQNSRRCMEWEFCLRPLINLYKSQQTANKKVKNGTVHPRRGHEDPEGEY